jgi:hypothetical protein
MHGQKNIKLVLLVQAHQTRMPLIVNVEAENRQQVFVCKLHKKWAIFRIPFS